MRAFISSQFGYCSLVWFFCSRKINSRMSRIQQPVLRIIYKDCVSFFEQLFEKDSSVPIHIRNLQVLATKIFKTRNNLYPPIVQNTFITTEPTYIIAYEEILFLKARDRTIWYWIFNIPRAENLFTSSKWNKRVCFSRCF